jgi:hypothetical protein
MSKPGVVNIKGKDYETVASRVHRFREMHPEFTLSTEIVKLDDEQCLIKASILNGEQLLSTGHAHEFRKSSQINGTSYVENCETSAIGRALASLGIGGTEFATANEVANAIHQQTAKRAEEKPLASIQNTAPPVPMFTADRMTAIQVAVESAKEAYYQETPDIKAAHDFVYGLPDSDEVIEAWGMLKEHSALRSAIKKHAASINQPQEAAA